MNFSFFFIILILPSYCLILVYKEIYMKNYLNFEKDIENLESEIEKLKDPYNQDGLSEVDTQKISITQKEVDEKLKEIYSNLDPWQITMVARHEDRPKAKFFIDNLFTDFISLSGDRYYGEDRSVLTGFAKFKDISVLVIGQEKGEDLESRIDRNFGMMRPEGYRKTIRLMKLADKFNIPIISFIDTPGAYPGVGAEERGQAEAIAKSIECCMELKVPTLSVIIGEGGSGGAIALASSSMVIMLENAIYSVISPEGCATILWRDPKKMLDAAKAMKLSSKDLLNLKVIDEIITEPLGGAHRDRDLILENVKNSISKNLDSFLQKSSEEIINERKEKFLKIGRDRGFVSNKVELSNLTVRSNKITNIFKSKNLITLIIISFIALLALYLTF
tara:strand:+ start:709 stop:1878 length:1170 start_codon:yes stop_codon:yes gene_type:complete